MEEEQYWIRVEIGRKGEPFPFLSASTYRNPEETKPAFDIICNILDANNPIKNSPEKQNPSKKKTHLTTEWEEEEKLALDISKPMSEAVKGFFEKLPESKRSKSSVTAYYYFKKNSIEKDITKNPNPTTGTKTLPLGIGTKVVYKKANPNTKPFISTVA